MKKPGKCSEYIKLSRKDSLATAGVFFAAFAVCFILQHFSTNDFHVPMIFVLVVLIVSAITDGYFYGILATFVGVFAVNYMFTYPYFQLDFTLTGYPLTFVTMVLVSLLTSTMTSRIKTQERYIKESEKEKIRANLLRGISHDIRTPLTGIVGATNALLENDDISEEKRKELLKDVNDDAQWLIRMVENVLSITRVGSDNYAIHTEEEIVEEIISESVYKFKKQWPNTQVNVHVPNEILFVPMDAMLIEQVIMNILHNSVIHGGKCTRIDIMVRQEEEMAVFTFHDDGMGFPDEKIEPEESNIQILLDSTEATDRQKNMGIGLSVCRTIISAHKGNLSCFNGENGGAVVEFRLPVKED